MVTHVDAEVGRVIDTLDRTGQADNTVVIFVSDHGDMQGDHALYYKGLYTFRGCVNIPYTVAAPGMPGGRSSDALVSHIDLMSGVLDLCGVPLPGSDWQEQEPHFERGTEAPLNPYPGRSWRGLLDGSVETIRPSIVIENDDTPSGYNARALVTPTHRLTVYPGTEHGELFNLEDDPDECFNLWYSPAHVGLKTNLIHELLDAYSRHTPFYPISRSNA